MRSNAHVLTPAFPLRYRRNLSLYCSHLSLYCSHLSLYCSHLSLRPSYLPVWIWRELRLHQEPPEIRTTLSMHNQRLHTTETGEELYQPVKTRPSETFHARMLMVWSMSAGTLIFFILVLGSALGLEYPAPRPPLLVLTVFYVTAAPIAYYLRRSSSIWTLRKDRLWSTVIILLDLAIGTAILFLTCLLYTSDAADDLTRVDLGGRRIIKKKKTNKKKNISI